MARWQAVVVVPSVIAGAAIARRASDSGRESGSWDVLGAVVAVAGMVALALLRDYEGLPYLMCLAAIAGGAAFALTTGLAGVPGLPGGAAGLGLGFAALLLCAQTLGQDVLHTRVGVGAVVPSLALFAVLTVVFLIRRSTEPVAAQQDDEPVPVSGRTGV